MPKLTVNETASTFTHVVQVDYIDLIAAGNGGSITLATIPAGGAVDLVAVNKSIAAAGSTSVVFDIGTTSADPDEFIDNLDADGLTTNLPVFNTGDAMVKGAATTTFLGGALPVKAVSSATPIYLKLTDAAVASLTAGKWTIGIRMWNLAQFTK